MKQINHRIDTKQSGFTLIELMIVVAIIGNYTQKARFTEAVLAASVLKTDVVTYLQTGGLTTLTGATSGAGSIPAVVAATATVNGSSVTNGVITITWATDGTALSTLTYIFTPSGATSPITWTATGTGCAANYC